MLTVRVIGWTDLADQVEPVLRAAGVSTRPQSLAAEKVIRAQVEPGTVDLVVAERDRELLVARLLRRRDPGRPLVLVGPARCEPALQHAVQEPGGADSYVTWPADAPALLDGIARAQAQAGQPKATRDLRGRLQGAVLRWRFAILVAGVLAGLPRYPDPHAQQLSRIAAGLAWMVFGATGFWQARVRIRPWGARSLGAVCLVLGLVMLLQAMGVIPGAGPSATALLP